MNFLIGPYTLSIWRPYWIFSRRGVAYHVFLRFGPYLLNRTTYRPQTTTKIFRNACWRKVQMGETSWLQPFACEKAIYAFGDSTDVIYLTNFVLNHPLILERAENRWDKPNMSSFFMLLTQGYSFTIQRQFWFCGLWTRTTSPIRWFTFWAISSEPFDLKILNRYCYQNLLKIGVMAMTLSLRIKVLHVFCNPVRQVRM